MIGGITTSNGESVHYKFYKFYKLQYVLTYPVQLIVSVILLPAVGKSNDSADTVKMCQWIMSMSSTQSNENSTNVV